MEDEDHIYDTIIISENAGQFIDGPQKTNELKFMGGKLYQKVITINYGTEIITQDEHWELVEGQ
jgi:hypothetical protein